MNLLRQFLPGGNALNLDVQDVYQNMQNGAVPYLLDVRQPFEFQNGHIPGSILVPMSDLRSHLEQLPHDRHIICICRSGARSGMVAQQLAGLGLEAYNLRGGMIAWQRAGLPIQIGN